MNPHEGIEFEGRALETCVRYVEQLQRLIAASFGIPDELMRP